MRNRTIEFSYKGANKGRADQGQDGRFYFSFAGEDFATTKVISDDDLAAFAVRITRRLEARGHDNVVVKF